MDCSKKRTNQHQNCTNYVSNFQNLICALLFYYVDSLFSKLFRFAKGVVLLAALVDRLLLHALRHYVWLLVHLRYMYYNVYKILGL